MLKILTRKKLLGILYQMQEQKCYYRSLFLYYICCFFDHKSKYRINILMHCFENVWGHAWLTRNGKTFLIPNRNFLPLVLEKIGENNRYIFWITT